jgi:hypothetical protein
MVSGARVRQAADVRTLEVKRRFDPDRLLRFAQAVGR